MAKLTRKQIKEGFDQIPTEGLLYGAAAGKHAEAKLTAKQREFARMIALGESKTSAYRKTHNAIEGSKRHSQRGYELAKRGDVQESIEAFRQAQEFAESHTPAQLRAFVIQQLTQKAQDEDFPPATRIKCLELLGKVAEVGAFVDRKEVVNVQSSQTIRERLLEKLAATGRTIEHKPDDTDAESLMAELTPPASEIQPDETHPTATPQEIAGLSEKHTHIIPHTQSPSNFDDMDIADAEWTELSHSEEALSVSTHIDDTEPPSEDGRA